MLLTLGLDVLLRFTFGTVELFRPDRLPLRSHFLARLDLVAGSVDATCGGEWRPVATPSLLVSGHVEPRTVIVTAASSGFSLGIGNEGVRAGTSRPGGARWPRRSPRPSCVMSPRRSLGSLVGELIVLTGSRTLVRDLDVTGAGGAAIDHDRGRRDGCGGLLGGRAAQGAGRPRGPRRLGVRPGRPRRGPRYGDRHDA